MKTELPLDHGLTEADLRFAEALRRTVPCASFGTSILAAAVARSVRQGHSCFELEHAPGALRPLLEDARAKPDGQLLGDGRSRTPLVVDADGRVYLHRLFSIERVIAAELYRRATMKGREVSRAAVKLITRLIPEDAVETRLAAFRAQESSLVVITGGPGTGKTTAVLRLLAIEIALADLEARPAPCVELLAPTGKAAARLLEVLRVAHQHPELDGAIAAALPRQAQTIHRALGLRSDGSASFHRRRPWLADFIVVDEMSMVDLELLGALLNAARPDARLILLGDADQLASVEAGSVLADLAVGRHRFTSDLARRVQAHGLEPPPTSSQSSVLDDCVIELVHSHRYEDKSGLGQLARAIRRGCHDEIRALFRSRPTDIVLHNVKRAALVDDVVAAFRRVRAVKSPVERHRVLSRFQLLSAERSGSRGVVAVNAEVRRCLGNVQAFFDGLPIMVRRNDRRMSLFNGDLGIADDGDPAHVWFTHPELGVRRVASLLLPTHDDAFAITVHQAQGSEFDHVAALLAPADSTLAYRQVVFTAVTRARSKLTLFGRLDDLLAAVARPMVRSSGLIARFHDEVTSRAK